MTLCVLFGIFITQVLKQDYLSLGCHRIQELKRPVVWTNELIERAPLMRMVLPNENLTSVRLTPKIDLFGVYLVWNINQEHVEEVVVCVIGLENYVHFV